MDKYLSQSSALFGSLKNAVLGNPVTREFQVGSQVESFGPGLLWKVFSGKKKSTGQDVSVFVLEKKLLDSYDKREREPILEMFRKGPQQLAKLRHPRILTVQHTLEESRDSLAFATEPVFASLANIIGRHENIPNTVQDYLKVYELYDVEKVYGLLQVAEGLTFLHNDVKMVEGNITPNNIVITKDGQWKLAGFNFAVLEQGLQKAFDWETRLPVIAKPELNYLAPEYILSQSCSVSSDMYSFGCLMTAVYNKNRTPFDAGNGIEAYKRCIEQCCRLGTDHMQYLPLSVREHVKMLLNIAPEIRPDANQTIKHEFFDDVAAMTLKYLHSLVQRDDMTKSQFFKNLHRVITKLPKRVLHQRVLPHLFSEFPNHSMIPFVLPNVFLIAENCSDQEFTESILPELKKIFTVQEPVQVLLIFMQKMELLLKKTPTDDVKNYVLPMVFRALESPSVPIEELVLSIIPTFAHMIDYSSLKNAIVPRIKTLILKTSSLSVRVNGLVCIGKIIEYLDKFMMVDDIFPALRQIPSKDPAVLMAILGIYKKTVAHKKMSLEKDYLATNVIPFLLPLSVDGGLNISQFNNYMSVIREMLDRVDQEHRTKLEQLSKMKEQQKSALEISQAVEESSDMKEMLAKVDRLVLGDPDKVAESSGFSEFSKLFGIVTEDISKPSKSTNNLMGDATKSTTATTSYTTKDLTSTLQPSNPEHMRSGQPIEQQPVKYNVSQSSSGNGSNQRNNLYSQSIMGPGVQRGAGKQGAMSQSLSLAPKTSTQQSRMTLPNNGASSQGVASSWDSMTMKNVNMTAQASSSNQAPQSMNANKPLQGPASQSSSLNSILTPEMKQFSSMQQGMSLNSMQVKNQQQQQQRQQNIGMQQHASMGLGGNPMSGGYMQSQTQSFTMYQTQTQHMMGGIPHNPSSVSSGMPQQQQHTGSSTPQVNHTGMLVPQKMNNSTPNYPKADFTNEYN